MNSDIFSNPQRFADMDAWREEALQLHAAAPVHRIEQPGFRPFWAVIGLDELLEVERQNELFTNEPLPTLASDEALQLQQEANRPQIKTLIHMDDPEHQKYRLLTNDWFKPSSLRSMGHRLEELSDRALATMEQAGGSIDFNKEVAVPYPLDVILAVLGLPEQDYPRMLKFTQELFGATDEDLQPEGYDPAAQAEMIAGFFQYFAELTADRRAHPTGDLATCIANGEIDGAAMPDLETMGYYTIVATAGHDTTSAAMSEGMRLLAAHPEQRELLRRQPDLIPNAVEEMIRFASPVRHFMRTARADTEIAGQPIAKDDWLLLSYPAANVDPRIFEDPLRFDVTRENANRQVAFGYGVHFCLGAHLARLEMQSLFRRLLPRLESVELAGEVTTATASFVSGVKTLPLRYELAAG